MRTGRSAAAAVRAVAWLLPRGASAEAALGDLEEEWAERSRGGQGAARAWYWREASSLVVAFTVERLRGSWRGRVVRGARGSKGDSVMRTLWEDLRGALRGVRRRTAFATTVVITLAVGIGGNVALFSVVDAVLLQPLPYADPDRLVVVWENDRVRGTEKEGASGPDYLDLVRMSRSYDSIGARTRLDRNLGSLAEPLRVSSARVTASYFDVLGVRPLLGRGFGPTDEEPGRDSAVLVVEGLWRRAFGADPRIVGRSVLLDGEPRTVVGVMPSHARLAGLSEEVFEPLTFTGQDLIRGRHTLRVIARLRAGTAVEAAQAEATAVMRHLEGVYPDDNRGRGAWVRPLVDEIEGEARPALVTLFAAVGLLLLMACASVANLVLTRGMSRRRELAVRTSLGAGPGRLFRLLLTENVVLGLIGGAAGVLVAVGLVRGVRGLGPADLPRLDGVAVDARALLFALAVSLVSALVFGMLPALRGARVDPHSALKDGGRLSGGPGSRRLRRWLVAFELATAVVLVTGAGLLLRSFWELRQVDPGYDPRGVLLAHVTLSGPGYRFPEGWPVHEWPALDAFERELGPRLRRIPGAVSIALAHQGPADPGWTTRVTVEGRPDLPPGEQPEASFRPVSPGYFRTLGLPLHRGRDFGRFDGGGAPLVAIVNEAFVKTHFPGEDPLGRRIRVFGVPREIVGTVGDERFDGLEAGPAPAMYLPLRQNPQPGLTVVLRSDREPIAAVAALREAVRAASPTLALFDVTTAEGALATSVEQRRFTLVLLAGFAAVALLLAVVGVYGIVSCSLGERTREVGVRMALGAEAWHVFHLVVREGMTLAVGAVALGGASALALGRLLERLLFRVEPRDPLTFAIVAMVLLGAAFVASAVPAARAVRLDPARTLRAE